MCKPPFPAIEVRGLSKRFGDVVAVENVSFSVEPGELFFLLGPSGCGKTTLLRLLAGLERPDSGTIFLHGEDVRDIPPHRRGAPMVFQDYGLWPHFSVFDNIAFGLVEQGVSRIDTHARTLDVMHQVGLQGLEKRRPGELSGGQQQRVVLARALVLQPRLVLLDEPLSNLDAGLRAEMRAEIERLHNATGITFLYVTHDQLEALSLADRVAVMRRGRVEAIGEPYALYHQPQNRFIAEFLGETNRVPANAVEIENEYLRVETPFGMWSGRWSGPPPAPKTKLDCLVRPEAIRHLTRTPPDSINYLDARVKSLRMLGSTVQVELEAEGLTFRTLLLNRLELPLQIGMRTSFGLDPESTLIVSRE